MIGRKGKSNRRVVVGPPSGSVWGYIWQCMRAAYLLPPFAAKHVRDFYHTTILGQAWLVIRAILPALGMIAIFGNIEAVHPKDLPYGLYVIAGMGLWTPLMLGTVRGTRSIKRVRRIIRKVYLPILLNNVSVSALSLLFFAVYVVFLAGGIGFYYLTTGKLYLNLSLEFLAFPAAVAMMYLLMIGLTSITSVIFLIARDVRMLLPMVMMGVYYVTPIMYPISILPDSWQFWVTYFNPLTSIFDLARWGLFGTAEPNFLALGVSGAIVLLTLFLGASFAMRAELLVRQMI